MEDQQTIEVFWEQNDKDVEEEQLLGSGHLQPQDI